jgi:hypothetical protein
MKRIVRPAKLEKYGERKTNKKEKKEPQYVAEHGLVCLFHLFLTSADIPP